MRLSLSNRNSSTGFPSTSTLPRPADRPARALKLSNSSSRGEGRSTTAFSPDIPLAEQLCHMAALKLSYSLIVKSIMGESWADHWLSTLQLSPRTSHSLTAYNLYAGIYAKVRTGSLPSGSMHRDCGLGKTLQGCHHYRM